MIHASASLDPALLKDLKTMVQKEKKKSLSELVSKVAKYFIERIRVKEERAKKIRNYKNYAKAFDKEAFQRIEKMAFSDITKSS